MPKCPSPSGVTLIKVLGIKGKRVAATEEKNDPDFVSKAANSSSIDTITVSCS
mgnify:CR=1 FL=1